MDHRTERRARAHRAAPAAPGGGRVGVVAAMIALILATGLVFGFGAYRADAQQSTPAATECPNGGGTPTAGTAAAATPAADPCVTVGSYDIYFSPNLVTIPADTDVRAVLPNRGAAVHNFSVTDHNNPGLENLGISVNIDPGQTEETTINAPTGDYYFYCNIPGHEQAGMYGYLHVEENASIATESATVTPRAGS